MRKKHLGNDRLGRISKNNYGSLMKIIEYNNAMDIMVRFEQGKPVHTTWDHFCKGKVKNPYDKSVYGIGYVGEGEYKTKENGKMTPQYMSWKRMLQRCYSEKYPTYLDCTVAESFHNFQFFAKWFDENFYHIDGEVMSLDKDILIKGNKIYSELTCVFVPQSINNLFVKSDVIRGEFPIGVSFYKPTKKYVARCKNGNGKNEYIGYHTTPDEAFTAYKTFKEKLIKQTAEKYKDKIPVKLYEALSYYVVGIDD